MSSIGLSNTLKRKGPSIHAEYKKNLTTYGSRTLLKPPIDLAKANQGNLYQDVLIANAQKKIEANTFTSEKKIKFMQEVADWVDKVNNDPQKLDVGSLTKLSDIIEKPILDSLEEERLHPVRYELHKNICISGFKLMQHCPTWPDRAIENLQLSTYLTNEKHCSMEHNAAIAQLADWLMERCKETKLKQILIDASH